MAITRSQQAKQMLQNGGMLVQPGFGGARQGYRGDAAAASGAPGMADPGPAGDPTEGGPTGAPSRGVLEAKQAFAAARKGLTKSLTQQSRKAALDKALSFLPGGKRSLTGLALRGFTKAFGPPDLGIRSGYNMANIAGPSQTDEDEDEQGQGREDYIPPTFEQTRVRAGLPAAVMPMQTMDLNRIAYRLMADGGFIDDEPRQAYGLGSIVKKAFKTVRKPFKAVTKTLKKVAKSPTGRLLLAVAAPYALGPAVAQSQFLAGLSAAKKAALISGATTGITQLASGEDLDLKDIALSAAIGGTSAKFFPPGGAPKGVDPSSAAGRARVASDISAGAIPDRAMGQIASRAPTFTGPAELGMTTRQAATRFTDFPTMRQIGVTDMPSVKQSGLEKLIASSRRGLGKIKDSKLTDILLRNKEGKLSPLKIASLAGLAGLATAKGLGEEEVEEQDRGPGIDIAAIRRRPFDFMAPRFAGSEFDFYAAEGGKAEPVAKKVMPLLDMDGNEMDLRDNGGFVPIGRMEKADDVPARLSKNEFVFTADAVRNAGEGDVDKGAEVMYNMMKNLEAGGEVSEESQGLEGARKMFQTSQRLEEVL